MDLVISFLNFAILTFRFDFANVILIERDQLGILNSSK